MITKRDLITATDSFFHRYWDSSFGTPPLWSEHWNFEGTIPNQDTRGCYALLRDTEIIYIGVGIGKSTESYHGAGLGDRLKAYWQVNEDDKGSKYKPTSGWTDVTSILTIGFDEYHYPLAAALEVFLIRELNPEKNSQHKNRQ